jgi:hypothetical protein
LKISFDTTDDSVEQVLEVIKAVYGVDVTLAGAPQPAQPREFEPVAAGSVSVPEQGSVSEPEVAAPAEEPVAAAAEQAAQATAPAKRTRSRSAAKLAKADAAQAGEETKTEPPKKAAVKRTATKKAAVNKPVAKKTATKKASAPRPRAATAETTAPDAAPGRGRGTRAAATKPASAQKGARPEAKLVRAWAREQGLENVPGRGTLPARIYDQYAAAHA